MLKVSCVLSLKIFFVLLTLQNAESRRKKPFFGFILKVAAIIYLASVTESTRCLRCDDLIQPRHCHYITNCDQSEDCFVEQFTTDHGLRLYNVGCRSKSACATTKAFGLDRVSERRDKSNRASGRQGSVTCTQCCQGDLCNSDGCGEPGYPVARGPICYDCRQTRDPSQCDTIAICADDEYCAIDMQREFGDSFYTTGCKSKHLCTHSSSSFIGKREDDLTGEKVLRTATCTGCCSSDFCNENCYLNGSITNTTTGQVVTAMSTHSTFPTTTATTYASTTPSGTQIRLVNGGSPDRGRVEVFYNGSWGTICDDDWSTVDATVVCRMLGYSIGNNYRNAAFGSGTGIIVLDDVHCTGPETDIADCPHRPWGQSNCDHSEDAGVLCSGTLTSTATSSTYATTTHAGTHVRLANGGSPDRGRVEVFYNGSWGTVCDDDWSLSDATVVCKMLGYSTGTPYTDAHFGTGAGKILLDDVHCTGSETDIDDCSHRPWGQSNCDHTEDAGVICSGLSSTSPSPFPAFDTIVRLVNGPNSAEGRVEVYHEGRWGTVCDDGFQQNEATVVCRMLGYQNGTAFSQATYGRGSGEIWIDEINCSGTEANIGQCVHDPWGTNDCDHSEDSSVRCFNSTGSSTISYNVTTGSVSRNIRLVNGSTPNEGRVEVYHNGQWGTVCDDYWTNEDATVVCRMLGYNNGGIGFMNARFGQGREPTWLDDVKCLGSETDIDQCRHVTWGSEDCGHSEDAGVYCNVTSFPNTTAMTTTGTPGTRIRLVDGPSPSEGRIEVFHNGQWGTVCDDFWVTSDANVVCRMLGYKNGTAFTSAHFGQGSGSILLDDVKCHGNETDIDLCAHAPWTQSNCGHDEDAGVRCI